MLLKHPRNEYIGGRWLCRRNSLSFSQSGRESNEIECHAQLAIFCIFEPREAEGEQLSWSASASVGCDRSSLDLDNCSSADGDFCLRIALEADIVKGLSDNLCLIFNYHAMHILNKCPCIS